MFRIALLITFFIPFLTAVMTAIGLHVTGYEIRRYVPIEHDTVKM
jgi:hypothetical protein